MGSSEMQLHFIIFPLHFIIFISAVSLSTSQLDLWANECSDAYGNYTSNSTYKSNLDKLLTNISTTNNIPYGFYNFSSGEDPDRVNAIALCRGDVVKVSDCHACLNFLISNLTGSCPTQMEAIGWAEKCMLRYSTRSILDGEWSNRPLFNLATGVDAAGDVGHFSDVVSDLLMSLPNKTADGDSRLKFATGEATVNGSHKVYGLMQCTPDLIPSDCLGCLYWGMYYVLHSDSWQTGLRILLPSCSIRYELNLADADVEPALISFQGSTFISFSSRSLSLRLAPPQTSPEPPPSLSRRPRPWETLDVVEDLVAGRPPPVRPRRRLHPFQGARSSNFSFPLTQDLVQKW